MVAKSKKALETINDYLEEIEDADGDSKLARVKKLIKELKQRYSVNEFENAAVDFFRLDDPEFAEFDKSVYNEIKAAYGGKNQVGAGCGYYPKGKDQVGAGCGYYPQEAKGKGKGKGEDQVGAGCRFNAGLGRCYTDKSTEYAEECEKTTGAKGKEGCARRKGLVVYGAKKGPAGYTGKKMSETTKAKIAATKALNKGLKNPVWVENPLFQNGGYWSADGDDMIDEDDTIVADELDYEGGEQLGAGCRFNAGLGRCYADKSTDYAEECEKTTGAKGKEGCARRKGLVVYGAKKGPAGYTGKKMSEATKAKIAATKALNKGLKNPVWVENPLFQNGGYWAYDEVEQVGAGCYFNPGLGRCYSDKTENYAEECEQTTGKKGNLGCSRRESLVVLGAKNKPRGPTGRKMSAATKAKIAATKAANKLKREELTWIENPAFQNGGYWA